MPLLAIPNISVGRPGSALDHALDAIRAEGARVLDVHADAVHNRTVVTATADDDVLITAMASLAVATREIDLVTHEGVHPRLGVLDVCPFVPHETTMARAVRAAHRAGDEIAGRAGMPVFFYGHAARRNEHRDLPDIRRGGLAGLARKIAQGVRPDVGPERIDPHLGVVCVGARGPLIAFNLWLDARLEDARAIATSVRSPGELRALAFEFEDGRSQVSTNLVDPDALGIDAAFARVERAARRRGVRVSETEIVGLVPERFLPAQDAKAARLLREPGRSVESVLAL